MQQEARKTKEESLLQRLPPVRGKLREYADLSRSTWFQVGGAAEVLFRPEDVEDLAHFLAEKPDDVPVTILGVGSNLLVRDGGIDGVVIRLGREFVACEAKGEQLIAGAGGLSYNAALVAQQHGIAGLEFLTGIPGSIGGALAMNAGAYGEETANVLVEAEALDANGKLHKLAPKDLRYTYRHCGLPEGWIFTRAVLQGTKGEAGEIAHVIKRISDAREATQPIRSKTGGSTFKNPEGQKAWELIDKAGCRGLKIGDAQVSEKHCNFLINLGGATADEIESLGEEVRRRVLEKSGVMLEWEIKRIGKR